MRALWTVRSVEVRVLSGASTGPGRTGSATQAVALDPTYAAAFFDRALAYQDKSQWDFDAYLNEGRYDDLAIFGDVLRPDDDKIAIEDPYVLHRLAANAQQIAAVIPAREVRGLDVVLDVLLGQHRLTGGDLTD